MLRPNFSKGGKTPWEIISDDRPDISPHVLLFPVIDIDALFSVKFLIHQRGQIKPALAVNKIHKFNQINEFDFESRINLFSNMPKEKTRLIIASTTSIQNSGLFDILIPAYEKSTKYNVKVEVIAVGTGKAIQIAKKGEADLLFVHDPFREDKFVAEGYGVNRRAVMHNDFVIVGPANDPAKIKRAKTAVEAFAEIARTGSPFVSRGDDSGTNIKEMDLWDDAGINPKGKGWYFEAGAKMGDTLLMADRKKAYTISDMGTFLNYEQKIDLKILFQSDPMLKNQYSAIAINPDKFPKIKYREAMDFIAFVTSHEGQILIASYKKHGVNLFYPDAVPSVMTEGKRQTINRRRRNET